MSGGSTKTLLVSWKLLFPPQFVGQPFLCRLVCHREKCNCSEDEKNTDAFQRFLKAPSVKALVSEVLISVYM